MQNDSPFTWFEEWYREALQRPVQTPSAVVLSTADAKGRPSSRVVLLKEWDQKGFVIYTNFISRKAKEIEENPFAALLFYWDDLGKQVRIEGSLEKTPEHQSERYFKSRPRESNWGAWASLQSQPLPDRSLLEERYHYYKAKFPEEVPLPEFWGGYLLTPDRFEFWQNGDYRLHQRTVFEKKANHWTSHLLYP